MVLRGYVNATGDGLEISVQGMMTQLGIYDIHAQNLMHFGLPGYQRKDPVVTSFVEYLGPNGVDKAVSTEIGRIRQSGNPLDCALNTKGYFQLMNADGTVELTRDGRMKMDKDGFLRSVDNRPFLSASGVPVQFSVIPTELEKQVKITANGDVTLYNLKTGKIDYTERLGIVSETGSVADKVDVKQGFVEDSNVMLQNEYTAIMPLRRQFEANRQLFIIQNDTLSRMIQELGRAQ
ncbi:MAG: flagellar basal body rod C-terminal domain-containing protein [Vampirovibrionales bacterium]|nr:flagellar basal body rod C-terminal domain-containing protein [Vampirovibrionales bacterium]